MPNIKAVVFDMDGVLIDAREWHYEALNRALNLFGCAISRYDHLVTYDGLPTRRKLEMLTKERGLPQGLHGFINEMKQIYTTELIFTKCKPIFQHQYALARLKAEGYRLAVASNSIRATIEMMMEKSGLKPYLDFMLSNQDVVHGKPHPEIYQKAIARFELTPQECLVVEDNQHGIKSARDAGAHVMVVGSVEEVYYDKILAAIRAAEAAAPSAPVVGERSAS